MATTTSAEALFAGVDVGTGSARVGLFTASGKRVGLGSHPIVMWRGGVCSSSDAKFNKKAQQSHSSSATSSDFVEQSSDNIWEAVGLAMRAAATNAATDSSDVAVRSVLGRVNGIGFDATCSMVVLDSAHKPVTVSPASGVWRCEHGTYKHTAEWLTKG